jgi:hypothetical protein
VTAVVLGGAAVLRLASILPHVANRDAFGWDSARRAVLDMRAGDALRGGHLLDFLWYVAGPETWPTLRLVPASIGHALAGPWRAFGVEHALSILTIGGVVLGVAYAARAVSAGPGATILTLLSTALLATNGALLTHAANGMLEPLSAALTTAAVAAWIEARSRGADRSWALAVFANLVFHTKWQHGLLMTAAVLLLEWLDPGTSTPPAGAAGSTLRALGREARTRLGAALLAISALLAALAAWIAITGGASIRIGGAPIGLRSVHGPLAYGALAAFLFLERALWRARASLRETVPARLRFAWAWLATPMAAWLLVPSTWRLRTILVTSGTYDSGEALSGHGARLWFYPDAIWDSWMAPAIRPIGVAFAVATLAVAWHSAPLRRRLAPIAVVAATEWLVLTFGTRHNFQARFLVNLAPILAVGACAWVTALPRRWAALAGAAALVAIAVPSVEAWSEGRLVATVGQGFDPADHAVACRSVIERLPVERFPLVNHAPLSHRQGCALWATVIARQRGERPDGGGAIVVTGAGDPGPWLPGYRRVGGAIAAGPLRAEIYEAVPRSP